MEEHLATAQRKLAKLNDKLEKKINMEEQIEDQLDDLWYENGQLKKKLDIAVSAYPNPKAGGDGLPGVSLYPKYTIPDEKKIKEKVGGLEKDKLSPAIAAEKPPPPSYQAPPVPKQKKTILVHQGKGGYISIPESKATVEQKQDAKLRAKGAIVGNLFRVLRREREPTKAQKEASLRDKVEQPKPQSFLEQIKGGRGKLKKGKKIKIEKGTQNLVSKIKNKNEFLKQLRLAVAGEDGKENIDSDDEDWA